MVTPNEYATAAAERLYADHDFVALLADAVAPSDPRDPHVREALVLAAEMMLVDDPLLRSLLNDVARAKVELDGAVEEALDAAAAKAPDQFAPRLRLREMVEKRDKYVQDERAARERIEGMQADIATARAEAAADPKSQKDHRRETEALQVKMYAEVDRLGGLREAIAELTTTISSLRRRLPAYEREARLEILESTDHARVAAARDELDQKSEAAAVASLEALSSGASRLVDRVVERLAAGPEGVTSDDDDATEPDAETRSDLGAPVVLGGDAPELNYTRRIGDLKRQRSAYRRRADVMLALALILAAGFPLLLLILNDTPVRTFTIVYFATGAIGASMMFILARQRAKLADEELTDVENELELRQIEGHRPERRAQKMLQVNQLDLRRYYDQTLRQGRLVFYLGVGCIVLGFAAVGGCVIVIQSPGAKPTEQIVLGALGTASAILANFIGLIYLKMFTAITASVGAFHTRLVGTHDLYFSNFLAAKVSDEMLQQKLFSELAADVGRTRNVTNPAPNA